MRLLQVVPSYLPAHRYGGPVQSVHGLSAALVARGHEVRVVTTDLDDGERLELDGPTAEIDGVQVRYGRGRGPGRLRYAPELRAELREAAEWADRVAVHGLYNWLSSAALRAAAAAGAPTVLCPRGMLMRDALELRRGWLKRQWLRWIDGRALNHVDALHLTSEREAQLLPHRTGGWPRSMFVPNGVTLPTAELDLCDVSERALKVVQENPQSVLFLGRLSWKKGLDRLLDAFEHLPEEIALIVAGPDDGWGDELARRVTQAGWTRRVHILGAVQGATKRFLLENATCLACPSYSENFANVVLEAMAAGCPPVVTREVGAAEWVARFDAGRVVPGDPMRIAAALRKLCCDPAARSGAVAGSARAAAELTWDAVAARFEAELEPRLPQRGAA